MAAGSGADWIDGPGVEVGGGETGGGAGGVGAGGAGGVGAGGAGGVGAGGAGGVGDDGGGGALAMGCVPPGVDSEALLPPPQPASDKEPQAAVNCHRN